MCIWQENFLHGDSGDSQYSFQPFAEYRHHLSFLHLRRRCSAKMNTQGGVFRDIQHTFLMKLLPRAEISSCSLILPHYSDGCLPFVACHCESTPDLKFYLTQRRHSVPSLTTMHDMVDGCAESAWTLLNRRPLHSLSTAGEAGTTTTHDPGRQRGEKLR